MKKKIKKRWIILGIIIVLILVNVIRGKISEATKGKGFEMPDTEIAKMLPDPGSNYGEVSYSSDDSLSIKVYKYSNDDFKNYIKECKKAGFDVDVESSDKSYDATNEAGYTLSLYYYTNDKKMSINLDEPTTETENTTDQTNNLDTNTEDTQTDNSAADNGDIRPEIKEAIDSYESFMNEYVEFMKKYESSDDVTSLAAQYTDFVSKYADAESKFDALENDDLNDAETTYYIEVQTRINNKLLEINQQ